MTNPLVPIDYQPPESIRARHDVWRAKAEEFEQDTVSISTRRAYERAWARFDTWCTREGFIPLPATVETVKMYASAAVTGGISYKDRNGELQQGRPLNVRTLDVHLAALSFVHKELTRRAEKRGEAPQPNPVEQLPKSFLQGIRRQLGKPSPRKDELSQEQVETIVSAHPTNSLRGLRDRAILLVAFASGGRRRSEITGMHREHLSRVQGKWWRWTLPKTKTHQHGEGFEAMVPWSMTSPELCPSRALAAWLVASGITSGPVFRRIDARGKVQGEEAIQPRHVADLVKEGAERLGLDPKQLGGHSLRAGFMTGLSRKGVRLEDLMERSGHTSHKVAMRYVHAAKLFSDNDPVSEALDKRGGNG